MKIKYPLLLDGGLSNELERQGCNLNDSLWSAKLLEINPEAITQAHLSYLESGAQCITTASYQASVPGFMSIGYDRSESEAYILKSVHLAEEAIKRFTASRPVNFTPLIAASIGPYGAYLADGSEYRGDYGISDEKLREFHLSRMRLLDRSNADFFACETIPSFQEAKILADILNDTQKAAWMSFSCKDLHHINDGTPIEECAAFLSGHSNIFAIGVNCTAPKYVSGLIKSIRSGANSKNIVVYPNSGEAYHAESKSWQGTSDPGFFLAMVEEWMKLGAEIVGGCCRIGRDHIKAMSEFVV